MYRNPSAEQSTPAYCVVRVFVVGFNNVDSLMGTNTLPREIILICKHLPPFSLEATLHGKALLSGSKVFPLKVAP